MSWCGCSTALNSHDLIKFINRCGRNVTDLKLNSISILNATCIDTIGRVCRNLTGKLPGERNFSSIEIAPGAARTTPIQSMNVSSSSFSELSIRNFPKPDTLDELCMGHFTNLERLDLFRSNIELEVLLMVLKNNPKLKHLNLGI